MLAYVCECDGERGVGSVLGVGMYAGGGWVLVCVCVCVPYQVKEFNKRLIVHYHCLRSEVCIVSMVITLHIAQKLFHLLTRLTSSLVKPRKS